jgi:His-Xaa-Ser system radical SAM maturase HxsC
MLTLRGQGYQTVNAPRGNEPIVARVCRDPMRPPVLRFDEAFVVVNSEPAPTGFRWYLVIGDTDGELRVPEGAPTIKLPGDFAYLRDGDVVRILPARGSFAALYRREARQNAFLLTERCNHYCLMCSQPPKDIDDGWIVDTLIQAIRLIDSNPHEIMFTGGEPTLLGERLVKLIQQCRSYLPGTALHILSNGRAFANYEEAARIAEIAHPDLMFGIPIYSDLSDIHDYVVQSDGAFDDTVRGVLNLKKAKLRVEIRVVIHKQTYRRLPDLARFLTRNLTFVDQVVLMGLEITGFTKANFNDLWIDPYDYRDQLAEATAILASNRMNVSIYNHQLCLIDRSLWPYARRSISDWKNEYMSKCAECSIRNDCGGFFSSAKIRYSDHIRPVGVQEALLNNASV